MPWTICRKGFRCVLLGEAELTLLEAVSHLLQGEESGLERVAGLAYLIAKPARLGKLRARFDARSGSSSFPLARSHRHRAIQDSVEVGSRIFSLNIVASRGCPYRCNWCAKPIYGDSFSVRSPALVAEEMRQLKSDFGAEHLWFADDIFGLRPAWVREFADEVQRLDAAIPFKMQSRVDLMTPRNCAGLAARGMRGSVDGC